jgi:hypothetical protein
VHQEDGSVFGLFQAPTQNLIGPLQPTVFAIGIPQHLFHARRLRTLCYQDRCFTKWRSEEIGPMPGQACDACATTLDLLLQVDRTQSIQMLPVFPISLSTRSEASLKWPHTKKNIAWA